MSIRIKGMANATKVRDEIMADRQIKDIREWYDDASKQAAMAEGYEILGQCVRARRCREMAKAFSDRASHLESQLGVTVSK